jgi:hypothetical protein
MSDTALMTQPLPYKELVQTCGPRKGPTVAASSRGVSLIDDSDAPAGVLALVVQLRFEHSPAGIQHGLGHPCLKQPSAAHIANEDPRVVGYQLALSAPDRILGIHSLDRVRANAFEVFSGTGGQIIQIEFAQPSGRT